MSQHLGLAGTQVPEVDPLGNRPIINSKEGDKILNLVGRPVPFGTRLNFPQDSVRQDQNL